MSKACGVVGRELVDQHIASKSNGQKNLTSVEAEPLIEGHYTQDTKLLLGRASRIRGSGWFKSVTTYQEIGLEIVGPNLNAAEAGFLNIINQLWDWTRAAGN